MFSGLQVYFEGQRGGNFRGDIAIDDISFTECAATTEPSGKAFSIFPGSSQSCTVRVVINKCDHLKK